MTDETKVNNYGIPEDPELAVQWAKEGKLEVVEDADTVESGFIIELATVRIADGDKVFYDSGKMGQPYGWTKVGNIYAALENEGAKVSDELIELVAAALPSKEDGKALASITAIYNSNQRANAKQKEYARINNLKRPMSEETKAKKIESMVATFAQISGVSLDSARKTLFPNGVPA